MQFTNIVNCFATLYGGAIEFTKENNCDMLYFQSYIFKSHPGSYDFNNNDVKSIKDFFWKCPALRRALYNSICLYRVGDPEKCIGREYFHDMNFVMDHSLMTKLQVGLCYKLDESAECTCVVPVESIDDISLSNDLPCSETKIKLESDVSVVSDVIVLNDDVSVCDHDDYYATVDDKFVEEPDNRQIDDILTKVYISTPYVQQKKIKYITQYKYNGKLSKYFGENILLRDFTIDNIDKDEYYLIIDVDMCFQDLIEKQINFIAVNLFRHSIVTLDEYVSSNGWHFISNFCSPTSRFGIREENRHHYIDNLNVDDTYAVVSYEEALYVRSYISCGIDLKIKCSEDFGIFNDVNVPTVGFVSTRIYTGLNNYISLSDGKKRLKCYEGPIIGNVMWVIEGSILHLRRRDRLCGIKDQNNKNVYYAVRSFRYYRHNKNSIELVYVNVFSLDLLKVKSRLSSFFYKDYNKVKKYKIK